MFEEIDIIYLHEIKDKTAMISIYLSIAYEETFLN